MEIVNRPQTPESNYPQELLRRNTGLFLASRGVSFQDAVLAGQNVQIELAFGPSSERGIPTSITSFLKRRYRGVDVRLDSILVGFEYVSSPQAGVHNEAYANQIQLVAKRDGQEGTLQETTGGIIVPHDESVRTNTITLLPDLNPATWKMQRIPLGHVLTTGMQHTQTLSGSLDSRMLTDIAMLIPDTQFPPQSTRGPIGAGSDLLKSGVNRIMNKWHPEPMTSIAPPTKSVHIRPPQFD